MDHSMHHSMHNMPMPGDGDSGMSHSCKMNMLLTWDYQDLCVLSSSWHIRNVTGLIGSIIAVVLLSMGYEFMKFWAYTWELKQSEYTLDRIERQGTNTADSLSAKPVKIKKTILYALQVFYSFLIMLIFMSFNWWLMISVAIGAGFGHYLWGSRAPASSLACH